MLGRALGVRFLALLGRSVGSEREFYSRRK
jgi:hypothetical protein